MFMFSRFPLVLFLFAVMTISVFAQNQPPAIEPGVPQTLAKWRAAHYSDVRYKLDITLEKGAPVMKGTLEIRVDLRGNERGEAAKSGENAAGSFQILDSMPMIVLDWRKIKGRENLSTVSGVSVNGVPVTPNPDAKQLGVIVSGKEEKNYFEINEHLVFTDAVRTGLNLIKLDFTSPIAASGTAVTRYVDKEDGAEYVYSLFVPSDASTAFPVFDQPDLKAKFSLVVDAPKEWKVVSNTADTLNAERKSASVFGYSFKGVGHFFEETKPVSTYVFAFAAGEFEEFTEKSRADAVAGLEKEDKTLKSADGNEWIIDSDVRAKMGAHIYVRKSQAEKFKQHAAETFRLNREAVKYLETYFDYKFPFPKYDLVLIPEFPFGGMEHAGATFLRESSVIFPQEPTANDYISRANLIFHEAAHQWFGDTVTMRWFDDLWLKEGFAEFMAYKTLEKVMPEYDAWKAFYERNKPLAYLTDSTRGTTPIYQEIPNLSAAKSAYGNIVYRKAPSFLRQAEFYLGEDKFQAAARAFLKKYEFSNAEWTDLVKEFETASKKDLKDWANNWVTKRGMPVISKQAVKGWAEMHGCCFYSFYQRSLLGDDTRWRQKIKLLQIVADSQTHREERRIAFDLESIGPMASVLSAEDGIKAPFFGESTKGYAGSKGSSPFFGLPPEGTYFVYFPNYRDYGYGIFLLDEKSRAFVLENIQFEKDAFLRSMMWGSLWDSVREAELDPKDYVELAIKNLREEYIDVNPKPVRAVGDAGKRRQPVRETDELTIQTILGRVSTATSYYLTDKQRAEIAPRLEEMLKGRMIGAPTASGKFVFFRAYLNAASTAEARNFLKEILGGRFVLLNLKTKDKFDIVARLAVLGDADAPRLLAELQKTETSDDAKRYAYAAQAGFATAENKAKFWNDFVNNREISESRIEAAFAPFNSVRHSELTLPYLEKALAELPNLKRTRKIFFVNGWLGAFIGGQKDEKALAIVNKFLADNPNLDRDLRLKILENADALERAVRIRSKYGK